MTKKSLLKQSLKLSGVALLAMCSSAHALSFSALSVDSGNIDLFTLKGSQHEYALDKTEGDMTYNYGQVNVGGPSIKGGVRFSLALLPSGSIGYGDYSLGYNRPTTNGDCGSLNFGFSIPSTNTSLYTFASCNKTSVTVGGGFSYTYSQNIPLGISIPMLDVSATVSATVGLGISATTGYGGLLRPGADDFMRLKGVPIPDYLNITVTPKVGAGVGAKVGFDGMIIQAGIKGSIDIVNANVPLSLEIGGKLYKRKKEFQGYVKFSTDLNLSSLGGSIGLYVTPAYIEALSFNLTLLKWSDIIYLNTHLFDVTYISPRFSYAHLFVNNQAKPCNMLLIEPVDMCELTAVSS
jgi:hypothetical protein